MSNNESDLFLDSMTKLWHKLLKIARAQKYKDELQIEPHASLAISAVYITTKFLFLILVLWLNGGSGWSILRGPGFYIKSALL